MSRTDNIKKITKLNEGPWGPDPRANRPIDTRPHGEASAGRAIDMIGKWFGKDLGVEKRFSKPVKQPRSPEEQARLDHYAKIAVTGEKKT